MTVASTPTMAESFKIPSWMAYLQQLPIVGPLMWILTAVFSVLLPAEYASLPTQPDDHAPPKESKLFPSMVSDSLDAELFASDRNSQTPQPCSTGLTTRLLPFKNSNGEIEWAFTDDLPPGSELDAFKSPEVMNMKMDKDHHDNILSPVTSNSSNNDSLLSAKKIVSSSVLPQVNTPSSTASEDDKHKDDEDGANGENLMGPYPCPHCNSKFKMRGYLTRHLKKHAAEKAYKCPFHKSSIYKDENDITHKCHPSGGFSRRDTYKTHLKSRHFRYPKGTSIKSRNLSPGTCSMCGEWFENGEIWCEIHIEGGECKYLPQGFKGKSRIKNRLKKHLNRMMKEQKQKLKNSGASLIGSEYQLPSLSTPNSVITPMAGPASYDYKNSPTLSVSSSIGHQTLPLHSLHETGYKSTPQSMMQSPPVKQGYSAINGEEDYDDDFCLDTDQLSLFVPAQQYPIYTQMAPSMGAYHSYPKSGVSQYTN